MSLSPHRLRHRLARAVARAVNALAALGTAISEPYHPPPVPIPLRVAPPPRDARARHLDLLT